jgi:hypothetical protein
MPLFAMLLMQVPEPAPYRTPEYRIENGQYAFYVGESRQFVAARVKLLVDLEAGVLLKHGRAEVVDEAFSRMTAALAAAGCPDFVAALAIVEDRFDLETLNRLISSSGSAQKFCEDLKATNSV